MKCMAILILFFESSTVILVFDILWQTRLYDYMSIHQKILILSIYYFLSVTRMEQIKGLTNSIDLATSDMHHGPNPDLYAQV